MMVKREMAKLFVFTKHVNSFQADYERQGKIFIGFHIGKHSFII